MASSEWVLGVHVQHFQYLYNAVFRSSGKYCCCDISFNDVPCKEDITDLNVAACTNECEPCYVIRFEVCFPNVTCSNNMKNETAAIENILATCISPLLVQLHSNESMIDDVVNVSEKKASLHNIYTYKRTQKYTCMYVLNMHVYI